MFSIKDVLRNDTLRKRTFLLAAMLAVGIPTLLLAHRSAVLRSTRTDVILNHIYIHGVHVGGLTKDEAARVLAERFQPALEAQIIQFSDESQHIATFTFGDFGTRYDFSELIGQAYRYGRTGGASARFKVVRALSREAYHIKDAPGFLFNDAAVSVKLTELARRMNVAPINAALHRENGSISVIPGKTGRALDTDAATEELRAVLSSRVGGTVKVVYKTTQPMYTKADLAFQITCVGWFETGYSGLESDARIHNIREAARRIDNTTVYPGEVFSAGALMNAASPDGYARATVIVNGQPTDDYGGGVCQVVTTLYNAVLRAELPVVERFNHSVAVSYIDYGFDATVAGDYFDFKFKNDTSHPLLVSCTVTNGKLSVALYGYEVHGPGRSLEFIGELVEVIPPDTEQVLKDTSLPNGVTVMTTEARDGCRYDLYKYVYEDGRAVGKVKVNTSVYKPVRGVVTIGG